MKYLPNPTLDSLADTYLDLLRDQDTNYSDLDVPALIGYLRERIVVRKIEELAYLLRKKTIKARRICRYIYKYKKYK